MVKKRNLKKQKKAVLKNAAIRKKKASGFVLPEETRQKVWGVVMFLIAIIISLSFFEKAGIAGELFMKIFDRIIGKTVIILPFLFVAGGLIYFNQNYFNKEEEARPPKGWPIILSFSLFVLGISGILSVLDLTQKELLDKFVISYSGDGGLLGNLVGFPLVKIFGFWVTQVLFVGMLAIGGLIFWRFLPLREEEKKKKEQKEEKEIIIPAFKIKEIDSDRKEVTFPPLREEKKEKTAFIVSSIKPEIELKINPQKNKQLPPSSLLEEDYGSPTSGDIKVNSAIIKRTLHNFDIPVEMSEVNIGPTVTQYTLKPAEGVKLSKITNLNNDLSLALAAHPIRIEAPIPGRSLVGVEIPNKQRALVRFKNIVESSRFQNSEGKLELALGRDVSGVPFAADLASMPHLLVAGSTGSGKTICLNTLIISLLYRNTADTMKLVLIDPKRVEFSVYNSLPHLLTPVIFDSHKTVNALKWLTGEMERRFKVLAEVYARDITGYNKIVENKKKTSAGTELEEMPYIVLIIDELADLMASRGRDIETGIVRIAQMARAVGIHLIVATQRPSVEVITGLIKANITSRIAFQVASQIDSRTILDTPGAEQLLGAGDMLFLSGKTGKPKRIQGTYVSEKEIKKVVDFIVRSGDDKTGKPGFEIEEDEMAKSINEKLDQLDDNFGGEGGDDPLYQRAKEIVIEAQKASASLLQRRLRVGYARAARLIDLLEEQGVVGPGEGAKPREIFVQNEEPGESSFS
ncbi:MAG: DNA translocase FtsK [bacterium]